MRGATSGVSHHVWGDIPISQQTSPYPTPLYGQDHLHILLARPFLLLFQCPGKPLEFCTEELEKLIPKSFIPPLLLSSSLPCCFP